MAAIRLKSIGLHAGTLNGQEHQEFNGMWKVLSVVVNVHRSSEKRIWPAFWNLVLDENCCLCQGRFLDLSLKRTQAPYVNVRFCGSEE